MISIMIFHDQTTTSPPPSKRWNFVPWWIVLLLFDTWNFKILISILFLLLLLDNLVLFFASIGWISQDFMKNDSILKIQVCYHQTDVCKGYWYLVLTIFLCLNSICLFHWIFESTSAQTMVTNYLNSNSN